MVASVTPYVLYNATDPAQRRTTSPSRMKSPPSASVRRDGTSCGRAATVDQIAGVVQMVMEDPRVVSLAASYGLGKNEYVVDVDSVGHFPGGPGVPSTPAMRQVAFVCWSVL